MGCKASNNINEESINARGKRFDQEDLNKGFLPDQQIAWIIDDALPGLIVKGSKSKKR